VPKYTYKCKNCDSVFEYHHSASDVIKDCESCGVKAVLNRIPGTFSVLMEEQVGSIVKNSIREFKEELETDKQSLRDQSWGSDE
jgi:putative FmdB family regulatory protein